MKKLKGVIFVLAGLFLLVTLISLLMPGRVVVTRGVPVTGDSSKIFAEVSDLKNWLHWQPAFQQDSAAITFSAVTDADGSSAEWLSNGKKNKLVITEKKYPYVKMALQREGDNDVTNILSLMPIQEQGNIQVQWESITKLKWYPWEKFGGIFVEKMSGPGYEAALQNLKSYIGSH